MKIKFKFRPKSFWYILPLVAVSPNYYLAIGWLCVSCHIIKE